MRHAVAFDSAYTQGTGKRDILTCTAFKAERGSRNAGRTLVPRGRSVAGSWRPIKRRYSEASQNIRVSDALFSLLSSTKLRLG